MSEIRQKTGLWLVENSLSGWQRAVPIFISKTAANGSPSKLFCCGANENDRGPPRIVSKVSQESET